jgi:hypothetical protein
MITDENWRIFVGDDVVLDAIDGIGDADEDEAVAVGWDDERNWDFGIYSSIESSEIFLFRSKFFIRKESYLLNFVHLF